MTQKDNFTDILQEADSNQSSTNTPDLPAGQVYNTDGDVITLGGNEGKTK
jgi:hypothetical protein